MELLASFFVVMVAVANSVLPSANIPQVLGVDTENVEVRDNASERDSRRDDKRRSNFELRDRARDKSVTAREKVRDAREKAIDKRIRVRRELQDKRSNARDKAKLKRDEFKDKLSEIRDERKAALLEKINNRLTEAQDKWVDHWNRVLSRLSDILAKMSTRADTLADNGHDMGGVRSAIAEADTAIASAQGVVNEFAGKSYVIEINDENSVGAGVRSLVSQFKEDMKTTSESVKAARRAVRNVLTTLKSLRPNNAAE